MFYYCLIEKGFPIGFPFFLYFYFVDANQRGCFAEYKFGTIAMENGFNVSMPLLDASPYDAIIEKDGKVFKIQIKSVSADRKKNQNNIHISLTRNGKGYPKKYVDYFAIYFVEYDGFFIIKNKEQKAIRLSIDGIYKKNFRNFASIL